MVFDLWATIAEYDLRPACYQELGQMPPEKASGRGLATRPKPGIPHTAALIDPVKIGGMVFNGAVG
jgi:hypothetical protein